MRRQGWFLRYVRRLTAAGRRQLLWRCGKYRFARPGRSAPRLRCIHASHTVPLASGEAAGLAAMAARLDGVTLRPGETLSCWRALGRRHRKENADQLAGLLLWMSLHTPLTVEECRLSGGEGAPGAACVYPEHDLMLTNDTSQCFQLRLEVRDGGCATMSPMSTTRWWTGGRALSTGRCSTRTGWCCWRRRFEKENRRSGKPTPPVFFSSFSYSGFSSSHREIFSPTARTHPGS